MMEGKAMIGALNIFITIYMLHGGGKPGNEALKGYNIVLIAEHFIEGIVDIVVVHSRFHKARLTFAEVKETGSALVPELVHLRGILDITLSRDPADSRAGGSTKLFAAARCDACESLDVVLVCCWVQAVDERSKVQRLPSGTERAVDRVSVPAEGGVVLLEVLEEILRRDGSVPSNTHPRKGFQMRLDFVFAHELRLKHVVAELAINTK